MKSGNKSRRSGNDRATSARGFAAKQEHIRANRNAVMAAEAALLDHRIQEAAVWREAPPGSSPDVVQGLSFRPGVIKAGR